MTLLMVFSQRSPKIVFHHFACYLSLLAMAYIYTIDLRPILGQEI